MNKSFAHLDLESLGFPCSHSDGDAEGQSERLPLSTAVRTRHFPCPQVLQVPSRCGTEKEAPLETGSWGHPTFSVSPKVDEANP